MRRATKSVFVSTFIVITLVGMSLSAIPNNQIIELEEEEEKFFSHVNVNIEGYQEDSIYTYSTLTSGGYTQCVITEDQRVVCWGNNAEGKRGLGGPLGADIPTPAGKAGPWIVGNLSGGMVEVSTGGWSTCSLKQNGEIWCWGGGQYGQLGTGTDVCVEIGDNSCELSKNIPPRKVSIPIGKNAVSLSDSNQGHFCAILDTGEGLCWGWNSNGELGDGTVCSGGSWYTPNNNPSPYGCNAYNGRYTPAIVDDSNFPTNSSFISISTGFHHTCGIIDNNDLYCWGRNNYGQLGLGTLVDAAYSTPQFVDSNVIAVSTGNNHACALYESQHVKCWGDNTEGQLGVGNMFLQSQPTMINLSHDISLISIESAYNANCAITEDFIPICWGANQFGQIGNYDVDDPRQENPLPFWQSNAGYENYTTIAVSINGDTTCQIMGSDSDNSTHNHRDVWCNGQSHLGQMGDGNWNQTWSDWNTNFVNLSTDYIGPLSYQGAGAIHISERDIDSDNVIAILDDLPYGCPSGSYDPNYNGSCVDAEAGHYSTNILYHSQMPCDLGTYQPTPGQDNCIDASPGHFVNATSSTSQQDCPSGTFQSQSGQSNCIDASPGYEVNLNSTNQIMCSTGSYQPESGQQDCIPSSPGYHVPNHGSTAQDGCEPGTYQPNFGASSCIDSSLGYFVANSNATAQEACSPGTYQSDFGTLSCDLANPGFYVDNSGSSFETACELGTYNPLVGATESSACTSTDPGHYVDVEGASTQTECPMGTYNPNSNSITSDDCLSADPGNYVDNTGSSEQSSCLAGFYQPDSGQTFCLESSSGTYVPDSGYSSSINCMEGTYQPYSGQKECLDTEPGYYTSSDRASSQIPCLPGSYQPETNSNDCVLSSPGYHVPFEGQAMQTICPAGYYQPQPGSSECLTAGPGSYSQEGATSPSPCLAGSYQSQSGQSGCVLADAGYFSSDISSVQQISCEPGEYQPLTGQSSCVSASRGYYVDSASATEEYPCDVGSYQPLMGSTECILSSINNYVASPGMATQTSCPSGESQPLTGQSSCNVDAKDSEIPIFPLIGGALAVALVIMGVLKSPKKPNAKKRKRMKKK